MRQLGTVPMQDLADAILGQEEAAWNENQRRQNDYEVHEQTQSIVLLFADIGEAQHIVVSKCAGWARLGPAAEPLMQEIIRRNYPPGGTIIRAMAAKLFAGGKILPHRDLHPSFGCGHRIHVPILTNPRVRFMVDGRPCPMQVGNAYEINNQKVHSVVNKGETDRINFIFDYVAPEFQRQLRVSNGQ